MRIPSNFIFLANLHAAVGCAVMEPFLFTNPEVRRETYVSAFVATLNDKSDGAPSIEKSITRLIAYGYAKADIEMYVMEAHEKQFDMSCKRS